MNNNIDPVAAWLHDALTAGYLHNQTKFPEAEFFFMMQLLAELSLSEDKPRWPRYASKDVLFASFEAYTHKHNPSALPVMDRALLFKHLRALLPSITDFRPRIERMQVRMLRLPFLEDAREEFRATTRLEFHLNQAA